MSRSQSIANHPDLDAPTPQNTPLTQAPIAQGMSRPTVPDITELDEDDDDDDEDEEGGAPGGAQGGGLQALLADMVQGKLAGLLGKSSGYIESLPVEVKRSVTALNAVQAQHRQLQNEFKRKVWELEKEYHELGKHLFERRQAIVTGTAPPTAEELEAGEVAAEKDDEHHERLPAADPSSEKPSTAPIDAFWFTVLSNHPAVSELITERDAGALKHLVDVRLSYLESKKVVAAADGTTKEEKDQPGYKLTFVFSPNEYFEDEVIEKTYLYQPEIDYLGDFMYDRAIGSPIKWKDDKNLTTEFEIKKQRNKNTNRTRIVRKIHPTESFFNFFNPPQLPTVSEAQEEMEDEELEDLQMRLELDYQLGEDFKERIIPRAVDYFTGKALEYEEESEEDDDEDDDEDEDEDEDQEDDSDVDVPPKRRMRPAKGGAGTATVKPEECKQQ